MKKIISVLLLVCLVLSLGVCSAYAESADTSVHIHVVSSIEYVYVNAVSHRIDYVCSCGTVISSKTEAHSIGETGKCAQCKGQIIELPVEKKYTAMNDLAHRVDYVVAGTVVKSETELHSFNEYSDGTHACVLCGYGKNSGGGDNGGGDNGGNGGGDNGGNGGNGGGNGGNGGNGGGNGTIEGNFGEYNGHYYLIVEDGKITWEEAEEYAESVYAHLVVITDKGEQAFVEKLNAGKETLWMGGYMENTVWKWVTGEKWDYTNWEKNYPTTKSDEDATAMHPVQWTNRDGENVDGIDGYMLEWESVGDMGKGYSILLNTQTPEAADAPEAEAPVATEAPVELIAPAAAEAPAATPTPAAETETKSAGLSGTAAALLAVAGVVVVGGGIAGVIGSAAKKKK